MDRTKQNNQPTKSRSIEHQAATLAQTLRKNRVALTRAKLRVQELEDDAANLRKTAPAEALRMALAMLGEAAPTEKT